MINLLCFADDMVILDPTWGGLQFLIDMLYDLANCANMTFNICKTVCMVFNPFRSHMIVNRDFPAFTLPSASGVTLLHNFRHGFNDISRRIVIRKRQQ